RLGDWAQWWLGRAATEAGFEVRESVLRVSHAAALTHARVGIRVALTSEHALLLSPQETILLDSREGTPHPRAHIPDDLHRIRETDPRRLLGDLYTAILRRLK
ncbi:MAG: hypothetical protein IT282_09135, partial [Bacteroidetes bacterium]|nr:hypothetical protein [Bacteroidota bacterium]